MIHKEKVGNEVYVYMNGDLLYKRWLDQGHGIILSSKLHGSFRSCDVFVHVTQDKKGNINRTVDKSN